MKRYRVFVTLLVGLAMAPFVHADTSGAALADAAGRALIGTRAPPLVLETIDGNSIDLGSLYGKQAVYLKFWATWCVPCRQQMPHFEHAFETAGTDMAVIAVNVGFNDSLDAVRKYRTQLGLKMPIVMDDGRIAAAFNLRVTPQHIVIGRDGRIAYIGHLADEKLDAALVAARDVHTAQAKLAQPPPGARSSPSLAVGASVAGVSLPTLDGTPFALKDPAGAQRTVMVFLTPWCESYLKESRPDMSAECRNMREQTEALAQREHLRWIGIASGLWVTQQDLAKYRSDYGVTIPLTLDETGAQFRRFGVTQVPTALVIDARGRLVRQITAERIQEPGSLMGAINSP